MMLKDLANALLAVPGKVIVILESCGSGAAIYANNKGSGDRKAMYEAIKKRSEAFDAAAISAFAKVDKGIRVRSGEVQPNTGEFRVEN
jgi:hypothetical protein